VPTNQIEITATVAERTALRYTPAGIEVLTLTLQHLSSQTITQGLAPRTVDMQIKAQLFGKLAAKFQAMSLTDEYVFQGFLAPMRAGSKALWLTVTNVEFEKTSNE
jgi:primosomal replication protein N